ncbi:hypothetical protein JW964_21995 [candidate division KSB1 bacterium]|nr:hypothetical protein [candidate division KSB1 bacterium]
MTLLNFTKNMFLLFLVNSICIGAAGNKTFLLNELNSITQNDKNNIPSDEKLRNSPVNQKILLLVRTQKFQKCWLQLPDNYDKNIAYPLLIALNGNGGDSENLAAFMAQFANEPVIIAIPEGLYLKPGGGFSWFYETSNKSLWRELDTLSVNFINHTIQEVKSHYRINNIFIFGFSQGATLAYISGVRLADQVTGIAAVGGVLPEIDTPYAVITSNDIAAGKKLRILIARGNSDPLVKKKQVEAQRDLFKSKGYEITFFEYTGTHTLTQEVVLKILKWMK